MRQVHNRLFSDGQHGCPDGRLVAPGNQVGQRHQGHENARWRLRWQGHGAHGCRATNIPGGEIYQALEKGTIDAAEWIGPYDDQKLGFNKAYEGLSAENKIFIEAAAAFAQTDLQAMYDARNPDALKQLVGQKVKALPFPKDVLDLAFKESMALYVAISAKKENWEKVHEDYAAFRKDSKLWFRFTEARFDSLMQAQKL